MFIVLSPKLSASLTKKWTSVICFNKYSCAACFQMEEKTFPKVGGSNFFIYCTSFQATVMFNMGGNLRIGLFGVKILIFNFLKIGLANDFDSFCVYLWVNPTKWPHKPFPWSFKINLCHVLERCAQLSLTLSTKSDKFCSKLSSLKQ